MKNSQRKYYWAATLLLLQIFALQLFAHESLLQFNGNKLFKIAQFTDTHFYIGGEKSPEVIENIKAVLEAEKPDLVIHITAYVLYRFR